MQAVRVGHRVEPGDHANLCAIHQRGEAQPRSRSLLRECRDGRRGGHDDLRESGRGHPDGATNAESVIAGSPPDLPPN